MELMLMFDTRRLVKGGEWHDVLVRFEDDHIVDAIHERNERLATDKAYWNWPEAKEIILVSKIPKDAWHVFGIKKESLFGKRWGDI